MHAAHMATIAAIESAIVLGGVLSLVLNRIELYIDGKAEEFFIEVPSDAEPPDLRLFEQIISDVGLEAMPPSECPAEDLPDGTARIWLATKEETYDRWHALQAV